MSLPFVLKPVCQEQLCQGRALNSLKSRHRQILKRESNCNSNEQRDATALTDRVKTKQAPFIFPGVVDKDNPREDRVKIFMARLPDAKRTIKSLCVQFVQSVCSCWNGME